MTTPLISTMRPEFVALVLALSDPFSDICLLMRGALRRRAESGLPDAESIGGRQRDDRVVSYSDAAA
jgi:hypothetical protein